jgi:hypothetical protein
MAQEMNYWVERRVILHRVDGNLTSQEFRDANVKAVRLVQEGTAPVHHVIDAVRLGKVELNLKQLSEIVTLLREPNLGWVVLIGGNVITRFLASVMTQQDPVKFRVVDTLDDAVQLIKRMDTTLPDIPPLADARVS